MYTKIAASLQEQGLNVKSDATKEKELAESHSVTGYPTLFMYRHGDCHDYEEPRDHCGIVHHMMLTSTARELEKTLWSKYGKDSLVVFE